ncbi:MAG TPA: helix-hairpin-helix domain-containing protein [Bacillales bacterium]
MSVKLPLTDGERKNLRRYKLKIAEIPEVPPEKLASILNGSLKRAKTLIALAEFQSVPSIGPKMAESLLDLGYFSLNELKGQDGGELADKLEILYGFWVDPCVEDVLRLAVHYAENRNSEKQWWDFTESRKTYRAKFGYPKTRPKKAWHETR